MALERRHPLWGMDWDEVDRNTIVELQFKHAIDHQIHDLIRIIDIDGRGDMGHVWIVRSRSDSKRGGRIALLYQTSQLVHGILPRRIKRGEIVFAHEPYSLTAPARLSSAFSR